MNRASVLSLKLGWDVWQEALVDVLGDEWGEWCETLAEGEENLEKGVQGVLGVLETELSLQALAVESDVPVGGLVDQVK